MALFEHRELEYDYTDTVCEWCKIDKNLPTRYLIRLPERGQNGQEILVCEHHDGQELLRLAYSVR